MKKYKEIERRYTLRTEDLKKINIHPEDIEDVKKDNMYNELMSSIIIINKIIILMNIE